MTKMFSYTCMSDFLGSNGENLLSSLRADFQDATGFAPISAGFVMKDDQFYFRFAVNEDDLQAAADAFKNISSSHKLISVLPDGLETAIEPTKSFILPPRKLIFA